MTLLDKDVILSTIHESHALVVSWRLAVGRVYIVAFSLMPGHHLLRSRDTLGGVVSAVNGGFGLAELLS